MCFRARPSISIESATLRPAADYLTDIISRVTGIVPKLKKRGGTIRLAISERIEAGGYMLTVFPGTRHYHWR